MRNLPSASPRDVYPVVHDHPVYGLSVETARGCWVNARPNEPIVGGWRVEDSQPGDLTIVARRVSRDEAYAVVRSLTGLDEQAVAAA